MQFLLVYLKQVAGNLSVILVRKAKNIFPLAATVYNVNLIVSSLSRVLTGAL
jgi:hypothetical protein